MEEAEELKTQFRKLKKKKNYSIRNTNSFDQVKLNLSFHSDIAKKIGNEILYFRIKPLLIRFLGN